MPKKSRIQLTHGWAIYLRTNSTDTLKPKHSLERQHDAAYMKVIHQHPLPVYAEYTDIDAEPIYLQKMLDDARFGKFSHIVTEKAEHFGRNNIEVLRFIDEMAELGIQVRFADYPELSSTNSDDRILLMLTMVLARRESRKFQQNTTHDEYLTSPSGGDVSNEQHGNLADEGTKNNE
jgi:DNA invertase Pin-like site-specific DNA recombinase